MRRTTALWILALACVACFVSVWRAHRTRIGSIGVSAADDLHPEVSSGVSASRLSEQHGRELPRESLRSTAPISEPVRGVVVRASAEDGSRVVDAEVFASTRDSFALLGRTGSSGELVATCALEPGTELVARARGCARATAVVSDAWTRVHELVLVRPGRISGIVVLGVGGPPAGAGISVHALPEDELFPPAGTAAQVLRGGAAAL